jgi:hypothetical protein
MSSQVVTYCSFFNSNVGSLGILLLEGELNLTDVEEFLRKKGISVDGSPSLRTLRNPSEGFSKALANCGRFIPLEEALDLLGHMKSQVNRLVERYQETLETAKNYLDDAEVYLKEAQLECRHSSDNVIELDLPSKYAIGLRVCSVCGYAEEPTSGGYKVLTKNGSVTKDYAVIDTLIQGRVFSAEESLERSQETLARRSQYDVLDADFVDRNLV